MAIFHSLFVEKMLIYLDKIHSFALIEQKIAYSRLKDQNPNKL